MFAQFQARYPTGSVISELVAAERREYIVRVSVQIEGVTRATGMAAADTIELAEDRARIRALEVLGIQSSSTPPQPQPQPQAAQPSVDDIPKPEVTYRNSEPMFSPGKFSPIDSTSERINPSLLPPEPQRASMVSDTTWLDDTTPLSFPERIISVAPPSITALEPEYSPLAAGHLDWKRNALVDSPSIEENEPIIASSKVTPIGSRRSTQEIGNIELIQAETNYSALESDETTADEAIDLSDAIKRTDIEIKRLGWTKKQGSEYLQTTYGKKTRNDLNPTQLLEFLDYLQSQPSP